ncbi:interferon-inducible GTPase 1-like [Acomys russatus]|uniref:interferon-inducible GTPase 1-like n=1 Tax=Acomys russatus TaxID=60746 RepID=UPI0021E283C2|nr:interferon-inducible GTPase 1-like [Acomys russatus]XP_051019264.1 interferon-inducible GTPase 1-like [Acomys russatus]XP_051019265.1 interferon-inducible GTPase 1-like [Acomys russatus]XP_051019266.1 interferon-inducible GTPase 1-like [Acomys russatus]
MGQLFSSTPKDEDHGDLESSFAEYFKNYKEEGKIISEETVRLIELHLKQGNIQGANSAISDALKNIDTVPINVAVTGESGAGKSSFINALRGVKHGEEGAAETGVTETTMEITPYKHPKIKTLTLWDLPGIGTMKFPPKDYLEKVEFKKYDFFVIVSATRFTKHEVDLAKAIRHMGKNYYFVRTKVDFDLENEKMFKPRTFDREKTLNQIRSSYLDALRGNKIGEPRVFLISNRDSSGYDFPGLVDILVKELPAQKRHNFMLSVPNITEAAIQRKYNSAKQFIWLEAMKDGVVATIPGLGILKDNDVEKLDASLSHYRVLFGVDDESLESMAKDAQVPVEQLKKNLKSPYLLETKNEETLGGKLLKYLENFASANGGLLATGLYFRKSFYLQFHFLDTVAADAKVLLREAYSKN